MATKFIEYVDDTTEPSDTSSVLPVRKTGHTIQFWAIFVALCVLSFTCALDVAIIATALPTITAQIGGATQYVWIANSFVIGSCAPQPLYGQLAGVLGRRGPFIAAILLFMLGSGIAGGAMSAAMLIAGRTVQGVGAGGIYVLLDIVCCDLVPLRQRGKYLGLMLSWSGVGAALGPIVGGSLAEANWRWIFYMNLPICALPLAITLTFFSSRTSAKVAEPMSKLLSLDYVGTVIFMGSTVSILIGLVMGGIEYAWSSWQIVVPIVVGVAGWVVFHVHQAYFTEVPSVPTRLFQNRTAVAAYVLTLSTSIICQAMIYFIPIYFQGVLGTTVLGSGIDFLPFAIGTLAFAVLSGILLAKFGAYRPLHASGFALSALGFGLLAFLGKDTPKAVWVVIQIVASAGPGLVLSILLPAVLASLPESDVAPATATFSFIRSFGYVWGVTVASIIFNATIDRNIQLVNDPTLQGQLMGGGAYAFASQAHSIKELLLPEIWDQIVQLYAIGLKAVWWFGLAVSLASLICVGMEEGLELRKDLNTEYGLRDGAEVNSQSGNRAKEAEESIGLGNAQ